MSNALVIPANATRAQVKTLISEMKSDAVHALSAASTTAARESFVTTCYAIAIQRAVFGSDEIFRNIRSKALTLPDYKTNKAGAVTGKLGKLLHAYGEALAVGKSMADSFPMAEDDCDLSVFLNSPTFGALIEAPKPVAKVSETPTKAETPVKTETPAKAETPEAPYNGNAATVRQEELHDAQWAAYGDALAMAQAKAREEASAPRFISLFANVAENNKDQAIAMLEEMAALLGYKLSKAKTVKKAA